MNESSQMMIHVQDNEPSSHMLAQQLQFLTHEVDDDQVQDEVAEEEVGEGTLVRDVCELELVFRINLDAEADCSEWWWECQRKAKR